MTALTELQNYTFISKYARWLPEKKRRETWKEAVDRVRNMMLEKYADDNVEEEINWVYDMMYKKKVLGSQRALQFGGKPILDKNCRIFNCAATYCDRLRFFQEAMYVLLCGSGVGFSVQQRHINKLPRFNPQRILQRDLFGIDDKKTYIIPDSIEGWSDSIGVLLSSYFEDPVFNEYYGGTSTRNSNVEFDYSQIRPKGSYLSSSSGKAPGPEPLKKAHEKIRVLLDYCISEGQHKLAPMNAYDIVMHLSDAVLSGGVRRSSAMCLFSPDDDDMLRAKTGNWLKTNPQRARSNNSIMVLRDSLPYEKFQSVINNIKEFGEPGFLFVDDLDAVTNPCQPGWAKILTPQGIRQINDINIGNEIWSNNGWTKVINKTSSGNNEVYKYRTTANCFYGTNNHRILQDNHKIEVDEADSIDICVALNPTNIIIDQQIVMDGLVLGDGSVHKASNNLVQLHIGENDHDYFESEIQQYITKYRPGLSDTSYEITTNITADELDYTYNRSIPDRYLYGTPSIQCSFLKGLFSANGGIVGKRISLKTSSIVIVEQIQMMLSSLGIRSYYTTNKSKNIDFANGTYKCKQSYDINISTNRQIFARFIGFIHKYKNDKLSNIIAQQQRPGQPKLTYDIISKEFVSIEETFHLTVDNKSHTYWTQGCNVSNCGEVGFYCYDKDNNSGWGFCNLSTINCGSIVDEEDFYERCKAASIIGTLQAGFTNFDYLGDVTKSIVENEALLGVSMTGMMDKADIVLNPDIQVKGATIVKQTNKKIAQKIGINIAARCNAIKPEGSSSCLLGVASGHHPHHAKRYLRRVQANTTEVPYQFFKKHNKQAWTKSVWSANGTDEILNFPIEVPDGAKTKNQLPALEMLELIKSTQQNWIKTGKRIERCVKPWLSHSVSNTVIVQPDEWDSVTEYIFKNNKYFAGISLLPASGDKDYPQAPFTTVHTSHEIVREYGEAALWCSGLIELALQYFEKDLWKACDAILDKNYCHKMSDKIFTNGIKHQHLLEASQQAEFIEKSHKFAKKYFEGDEKRLTYCLKDVYNWKLYYDLKDTFVKVDYKQMIEENDGTNFEQEAACAGGACLV